MEPLREPEFAKCQEKVVCSGDTAEIKCIECGTFQCKSCESLLHSTKALKHHQRQRQRHSTSGGTSPARCELWCSSRNVVALHCKQCKCDMCGDCDEQMHKSGERAKHERRAVGYNTRCCGDSGFLLLNNEEKLMIEDTEKFIEQLGCTSSSKAKVVSIFGNTGDGKSHTLNQAFFHGREVFNTSSHQDSCTLGVWAAYSSEHSTIFIDTEGMLGASRNDRIRTRLLLKVLAVSDVVIYRSRAERLHNDLFEFLGDASDAYWKYLSPELKAASDRFQLSVPLSALGPAVVIFHETQYTLTLGAGSPSRELSADTLSKSAEMLETGQVLETDASAPVCAEDLLRARFSSMGQSVKSFSSVQYVGTQTQTSPTDFSDLFKSVCDHLQNSTVRSSRTPDVIFKTLQSLNDKFSGDIQNVQHKGFLDAYFTCPECCLACRKRCELSMNHMQDGVSHKISTSCCYNHQYDNKQYLCKVCYNRGIHSCVVPKTSASTDSSWTGLAKYAWSGYLIECKNCGVIYRSRQHWYGNKNPEHTAVKTENKHVWPSDLPMAGQDSTNTVRRLVDGVGSLAETMGNITSTPSKAVSSWVADQIAPKYWVPNHEILVCGECKKEFTAHQAKHHCRSCGKGFCEKCSSKTMPVPWRGWGSGPVRVCDSCYEEHRHKDVSAAAAASTDAATEQQGCPVTARYIGEVFHSTVSTAIDYPRGLVVESSRPKYWVPDAEIKACHKCKREFETSDAKHHCRACGQGFCDTCASERRPVPSKGWDYPVRVCSACSKRKDL